MTSDPVLVIASDAEHPGAARVWGTGGWTPPEEREARDWLTLCRLLGWGVQLAGRTLDRIPDGTGWILIACDPDELSEQAAGAVLALLERSPALVVARAARPGTPLARIAGCSRADGAAGGRSLCWLGPGGPLEWELAQPALAAALDGPGEPRLTLDGQVVARATGVALGTVVTLGVHPSEIRDGGAAAALRVLLTRGPGRPVAWLDMEGVLALRMDDPGGSQNVHLDPFAYRELGPDSWLELAAELRGRRARLGVAAVPGWIDDGDASRGELLVGGRRRDREPARVHPSWEVTYRDRAGVVHDYAGEFAALRELNREGLVDIALHGHTHVFPDAEAWARAADRHTAEKWYREFGTSELSPAELERRLATGMRMLGDFFRAQPNVLVFPGDAWTDAALEAALGLDISLVASYYVALRDGDRFCWAEQLCSPYIDEPDPSWFAAGLPVVGYFHARDVAEHGAAWLGRQLDAWSEAGARRVLGLGELAFALETRVGCAEGPGGSQLVVTTPPRGGGRLRVRHLEHASDRAAAVIELGDYGLGAG